MKGEKRTEETERADNNREKKLLALRRLGEFFDQIEKDSLSGSFTLELSAHVGKVMKVFHGSRVAE